MVPGASESQDDVVHGGEEQGCPPLRGGCRVEHV